MIEILAEREFPVAQLHLLASERSDGKARAIRWTSVRVKRLDQFDFEGVEIALFSAGASVSAEFAPRAAAAGCVVIDNTSQFRYDDDIPLVVPEVNAHAIAQRHAPRNHCQSELFNDSDGGCAEADPRCGGYRANQRRDVSVGFGRGRQGRFANWPGQTADLLNAKPSRAEGLYASRSHST